MLSSGNTSWYVGLNWLRVARPYLVIVFGFIGVRKQSEEDRSGACCQSSSCFNYVGWWVSGGAAQVGSRLIAHWASQRCSVLDPTEALDGAGRLQSCTAWFFCRIRPWAHWVLSESNDVVAAEVGHLFRWRVFFCHHLCTLGFGYFYKNSVPHLLYTLRRRRRKGCTGKRLWFFLASVCLCWVCAITKTLNML